MEEEITVSKETLWMKRSWWNINWWIVSIG